jgi:hypothetical protein
MKEIVQSILESDAVYSSIFKEPLHCAEALFDARALLGDPLVKTLLRLAQL